jgi:hypothetical protein
MGCSCVATVGNPASFRNPSWCLTPAVGAGRPDVVGPVPGLKRSAVASAPGYRVRPSGA